MYKLIITLHAHTHVLAIISYVLLFIVDLSDFDQHCWHICDQREYASDHVIAPLDQTVYLCDQSALNNV